METIKRLLVYKENGDFVVEHVNAFNHATKRHYISEDGLREGLAPYKPIMHEYDLQASEELKELVQSLI